MTQTQLQSLRRKVLALGESERAELAADLLDTLGEPPGARAAEDWDAEIASRIERLRAGDAVLVDAEVVMARMRAIAAADLP